MPVEPISHKGKLELCQSGGHEGEFELGQSALNVRTPSALPATTRALPILNDRTAGRCCPAPGAFVFEGVQRLFACSLGLPSLPAAHFVPFAKCGHN
jgi:hypothetical protein